MIDNKRIPEVEDYKFGFILSHIMLCGKEVSEEIKENPKDFEQEKYFVELQEQYIWLEGIDWHVKLPDNVYSDIIGI